MGLDMYLDARVYLSSYEWEKAPKENELAAVISSVGFTMKDLERPSAVVQLPLGYWRKANAIHDWFVKNVQEGNDNCADYEVSREQLEELRSLCDEVLANPDKGSELLPTSSGFFFGSTEYDEYYLEDLRQTVRIITRCLEDARLSDAWFVYRSSW